MKAFIFILIALSLILSIFVLPASAQNMENSMYKIQSGNIKTFSPDLNVSDYNLNDNSALIDATKITGFNFEVNLGDDYRKTMIPFSFSISDTQADFGSFSPTNPVSRNINLIIKNSKLAGYKVTAAQNHELTEAKKGSKIPDTTCDNGQCTETVSAKWDSTLAYGFGYRCDSSKSSCVENDKSFELKNFFKQFPNSTDNESATTILSEGSSLGQEASTTYKVNISSSQPSGSYSNSIIYLAIPSY